MYLYARILSWQTGRFSRVYEGVTLRVMHVTRESRLFAEGEKHFLCLANSWSGSQENEGVPLLIAGRAGSRYLLCKLILTEPRTWVSGKKL